MDPSIQRLIESVHRSPSKVVLAITGGGTSAAAQLLEVPGASRTILEVVVPYHHEALCEFLGQTPESFCSAATSRALAGRARDRARWLTPGEPIVGIGCTASLVTDRPKHGDHRLYVS